MQPEEQSPFLSNDVLAEVAGRLRFGGPPIEQKIEQMSEPEPAPWSWPTHQKDYIAKHFGLRGFEFNALQEEAMRQLPHNEMLRDAYSKFLMIAKLTCNDAVEKVRAHERHQAEERMKRESSYRSKKQAYDARVKSLTKSWSEVRATIKTRWKRMGKSVMTMLERDARLSNMAPRDLAFMEEMSRRGVAGINRSENVVVFFNWDKFTDFSIEDINEVVLMLDQHPSGGFIRKPTVVPLSEA
jgi:hypothetical protein